MDPEDKTPLESALVGFEIVAGGSYWMLIWKLTNVSEKNRAVNGMDFAIIHNQETQQTPHLLRTESSTEEPPRMKSWIVLTTELGCNTGLRKESQVCFPILTYL